MFSNKRKKDKMAYSMVHETFIIEEDGAKITTSDSTPATAGGTPKNNIATAMKSGNASDQNKTHTTDEDKKKVLDTYKVNEDKKKEINTKAGIYNQTALLVLQSKLTSAEKIYNEYMKIIKAHVKTHVGNKEQSADVTANAGTDWTAYGKQVENVTGKQLKTKEEMLNTAKTLIEEFEKAISTSQTTFNINGKEKPIADAKKELLGMINKLPGVSALPDDLNDKEFIAKSKEQIETSTKSA